MYNRLSWPRKMAEFMSDTGCEVYLVDNGSTYPPLLEWYEACPYKKYFLNSNFGHQVIWTCAIVENNHSNDPYFIVTDPDLDISNVPHDYTEVLKKELDASPDVTKTALSLEINDLPKTEQYESIIENEKHHWKQTVGNNDFYLADTDTTFALYRNKPWPIDFYRSHRAPRPYTAKHLPWYLTKEDLKNSEEELYYYDHINLNIRSVNSSDWKK